jgi:hypothetical protein
LHDREDIAGSALARALEARLGAPVAPEQGRTLLLSLIRLHELGALSFAPQLSTVPGPEDEPGAVVRCDQAQPDRTAPAYNMGQSIYKMDDSK